MHNFGGGDYLQSVTFKPGSYSLVLQWDDNFYSLGQGTGATNDLDIYLANGLGGRLFGLNSNNIGGDPYEILQFTVAYNTTANIIVRRASNSTTPIKFKYVVFRGDMTVNEYRSGESTIVGHANAEGAMTVGAVRYTKTPAYNYTGPFTTEVFTSLGGSTVNGSVRNKPDFSAPDEETLR